MMLLGKRVLLIGRNLDDLIPHIPNGVELVSDNPDFIICHGGDGTLLGAERSYPGIPKLALRDSRSNPKCPQHAVEKVLAMDLKPKKFMKMEVVDSKGRVVVGVNDIVLHNADPCSAIRYHIWIDGEPFLQQIVGDGLVASTPFGSSAYYKSITGSTFNVGFGIAFNNSTEPMNHLVLSDESTVEVMVTRGPAILFADNDPSRLNLSSGDKFTIRPSKDSATFYGIDIFRCLDCYVLRRKFWIEHWEK